jgi:hypothetical protein
VRGDVPVPPVRAEEREGRMSGTRLANLNWVPGDEAGQAPTWERVNTAILLDIRDELRKMNQTLRCPDFQSIPRVLKEIRRNTTKPKKAKP